MTCANPFFKCEGKSNKIATAIKLKGKNYEICEDCWNRIILAIAAIIHTAKQKS